MHPADVTLLQSWQLSLHDKRPATVELYLREVGRFADWTHARGLSLLGVTKPLVLEWITEQQRAGRKGNTVRTRFYNLRAFYRWALAEDEIPSDPTAALSVPRPHEAAPVPLSGPQLTALFKACEGVGFRERRDTAMLRMFAATGVRAGEMIGFDLGDIDLQARIAAVRNGKGGRPRVVRFDAATAATLDRYRRVRARHRFASSPRLWLGQRGPLTIEAPTQICERRGLAAGIQGLHPHRLRHTFADRYLSAGGSEGDLQKLGGWENSEIMRRYGEARAVDRALGAYDLIDPMRGL